MVRGGRVGGRAKGADVYDGPLKLAAAALFRHFIGGRRQDARDGARVTPGDDVVGFASGT